MVDPQANLKSLLMVSNLYNPVASLHEDRSDPFKLIPKAVDFMENKQNSALIIISENMSCTELTLLSLCDQIVNKNNGTTKNTILVNIDCTKIAKKCKGLKNTQRYIYNQTMQEIQNKNSGLKINNQEKYIIMLRNFEALQQKNLVLGNYLTEEEINNCFFQSKLIAYLKLFDTEARKQIMKKIYYHKANNILHANLLSPIDDQKTCYLIHSNTVLWQMSQDIINYPLISFVKPFLQQEIQQEKFINKKLTEYQVYELFTYQFILQQYQQLSNYSKDKLINYFFLLKVRDLKQIELLTIKYTENLLHLLAWRLLRLKQQSSLPYQQYEQAIIDFNKRFNTNITNIAPILITLTPIIYCYQKNLHAIPPRLFKFFVAQSIVQETLEAQRCILDQDESLLNQAFLSDDIEILTMVGEYVMQLSLDKVQYPMFCEVWYKSVLLSRKIRTQHLTDQQEIAKLQHLASNCLSLIASLPHSDLNGRDFSECAIPQAYLCGRDLTGCNFVNTNLQNCFLNNSKMDKCVFASCGDRESHKQTFAADDQYQEATANCVAFAPDGRTLASAGELKTVKLWDVLNSKEIATLKGHKLKVNSVAFSGDGKLIASASEDKTLRFWNRQTHRLTAILTGHTGSVHSVAFSQDASLIASGSSDNTIRLWSVSQRVQISLLSGHTDAVLTVAFSSDSQILASGSRDNSIRLWNTQSEQEIAILNGHSNWVSSVTFSANSKVLASGSWDHTVIVWDVKKQSQIHVFKDHSQYVCSVAFSTDCKILASGSGDNSIKIWSMKCKRQIDSLNPKTKIVFSVAFSPDSTIIASGNHDCEVKFWQVNQLNPVTVLNEHTRIVFQIAFSPDSKMLASASQDKTVKLWNTESKTLITTLLSHNTAVKSVSFSADSTILASGGSDGTLILWDVKTKEEITSLKGQKDYISQIIFTKDCKKVITSGHESTLNIWDLENRSLITTLKGFTQFSMPMTLSPDEKIIASLGPEDSIKLWSLQNYEVIGTLKGHTKSITSLAFSHDGRLLASGSQGNNIRLWSMHSKKRIGTLKGHSGWVFTVKFSPDSQILVSASGDTTIKLWNVKQQTEILTLEGHQNRVFCANFSPDYKMLASCGCDRTIKFWRLGSVLQTASEKQESQEEQQQFFNMRLEKELTIGLMAEAMSRLENVGQQ